MAPIGRVVETKSSNSRILLLTDPNSSISIKTVTGEVFSLVSGAGDNKYLVSKFIKDSKMQNSKICIT